MTRIGSALLTAALLVGTASATPTAAWAQAPLPTAKPEEVGMSAARLGRITKWFKAEIDEKKLPGAVIAVARQGKLVYYEAMGYRDAAKKAPMAKDSIFRIYSMTKPIVSVAAMMLVEDGKIQLTDPVAKFLPDFKDQMVSVAKADGSGYDMVKGDRAMTVQDLLRHTSGLAYGEITRNQPVKDAYKAGGMYKPGDIDFDARAMTPAEQNAAVGKAPLAHQPAAQWEYSHSSDILGRVVEAASKMRLADFVRERIAKPLKMADTGFWVAKDKLGRVAQAFDKDPATGNANKLIDVSIVPKSDSGGAGGVGTAADYLRFSQMLLNGGTLDGARLMSRTTVALMTADHLGERIRQPLQPGELLIGTQGYGFGLGFAVRKQAGIAGVPGSTGEYMWAGYAGTFFWVDPTEQLAVVMMTQAPSPVRAFYRRQIKQLVYQAIVDEPAPTKQVSQRAN